MSLLRDAFVATRLTTARDHNERLFLSNVMGGKGIIVVGSLLALILLPLLASTPFHSDGVSPKIHMA